MANVKVSVDIKWTSTLNSGNKEISQQHVISHIEVGQMTEANFKLLAAITDALAGAGDEFFD
jgi:hypothetical protein